MRTTFTVQAHGKNSKSLIEVRVVAAMEKRRKQTKSHCFRHNPYKTCWQRQVHMWQVSAISVLPTCKAERGKKWYTARKEAANRIAIKTCKVKQRQVRLWELRVSRTEGKGKGAEPALESQSFCRTSSLEHSSHLFDQYLLSPDYVPDFVLHCG